MLLFRCRLCAQRRPEELNLTQFFLILLLVAVPNALQIAILVALLLLLVSNFTNKPLWVGAAAATHDSATAGAGASTMFRFTRTIPTLSYDAIFNISSSSQVYVDVLCSYSALSRVIPPALLGRLLPRGVVRQKKRKDDEREKSISRQTINSWCITFIKIHNLRGVESVENRDEEAQPAKRWQSFVLLMLLLALRWRRWPGGCRDHFYGCLLETCLVHAYEASLLFVRFAAQF